MKYHTLFFGKLGKMSENLSSAAVVIGALRVNTLVLQSWDRYGDVGLFMFSELVEKKVIKDGFCPILSALNFDRSKCHHRGCYGHDGRCPGDAKCCKNFVCGHRTCASPVGEFHIHL